MGSRFLRVPGVGRQEAWYTPPYPVFDGACSCFQVKLTRDNGKEGFPITALRETNVLLSLHHPNIVRVLEMVIGSSLDKVGRSRMDRERWMYL